MKTCPLAILVLLITTTSARAGMVLFDPPSITITPGTQSVSFSTRAVPESLASFDSVTVIFGSLEGLELSFYYDPFLFVCLCIPPAPPAEVGIYAALTGGVGHDVGVGANNLSANPWTSVTLGTLTVDTSGLAAGEVRQIIVDPELETGLLGSAASLVSSGYNQDPLRGSVTITVVPEPGIVGLMVVGMFVGCVRRSRREENPQPRWGWKCWGGANPG